MRYLILLSFLLPAVSGSGQNLVPNGSFEEYTECPEYISSVFLTEWINLHTTSADYFNRCQENLVVGVPFNWCGYQEPADGEAYVGMATTFPGLYFYREIIGIELIEPLQAGVPICLSFKMALGGFGSWDGSSAIYTAKGIGLHFFNEFPSDWTAFLYPNAAALSMDIVPMDTALWYTVSGEYVPDSNYRYVAVGNFFNDSLSSITDLDTSGAGAMGASYAFIDDVRASFTLEYCASSGVVDAGASQAVQVYPNPCAGPFTVALPGAASGPVHWELVSITGQRVGAGVGISGARSFTVLVEDLAQGTYVLRLQGNMGAYAPVRLIAVSP